WLALEHVRKGSARIDDVQMLVADGFDQFNRLHVELLTALARRISRTVVTLTQVGGARAPRFRRFVETRQRLMDAGPDLWQVETVPGDGCGRAKPLQHLIDTVFDLSPHQASAGDAVE